LTTVDGKFWRKNDGRMMGVSEDTSVHMCCAKKFEPSDLKQDGGRKVDN